MMKFLKFGCCLSFILAVSGTAQAEPYFFCKSFWGSTRITLQKTAGNKGIVHFKSRSVEFTAPYTMWKADTGGGAFETSDKHQLRIRWGYFHDNYLPSGEEKNGYYVTEKRPYDIEYINDRGERVIDDVPCWSRTRIQQ